MPTFLTAEWRKLIMAQYEVNPSTLAPWLPRGVELDLQQGKCYVSLVGFLFDRVLVKGLPVPFHRRFEEVNLRFYLRRSEADGTVRRGVVFIREFVPRAAITLIANAVYDEPYATLPTRSSIVLTAQSLDVQYAWKHLGQWHSLAVETAAQLSPIAEGSEEEFITEHYWGFTKRRNGTTSQYQVEHPRWGTYALQRYAIRADFEALYGSAFAMLNGQEPASVLLAEGSAVSVHAGTRLGIN